MAGDAPGRPGGSFAVDSGSPGVSAHRKADAEPRTGAGVGGAGTATVGLVALTPEPPLPQRAGRRRKRASLAPREVADPLAGLSTSQLGRTNGHAAGSRNWRLGGVRPPRLWAPLASRCGTAGRAAGSACILRTGSRGTHICLREFVAGLGEHEQHVGAAHAAHSPCQAARLRTRCGRARSAPAARRVRGGRAQPWAGRAPRARGNCSSVYRPGRAMRPGHSWGGRRPPRTRWACRLTIRAAISL